jgi:NADH-quinone oxidoreductase subunit M
MTPLLVLASLAASWSSVREKGATYYGLVLALQAGLMGLFAAQDILLFYVAFEFTLIPSFLLIAWYGGGERKPAAITFVIYTLAGSLLTLVGLIALVTIHWAHSPLQTLTFSIPELTSGLAALDWEPWHAHGTWTAPSAQGLVFLLLLAGFAVKTPIFPFHAWLPPAYQQSPTAITILIAGAMSKLGTYGLVRFNLAMTPLAARTTPGWWRPWR